MRSYRAVLSAIILLATTSSLTYGQLTSTEIDALREHGKKEGWKFAVGENPATQHKLSDLCGLVEPPDWRSRADFVSLTETTGTTPSGTDSGIAQLQGTAPASFDWRLQTGLPPIRNQGGCGSCWAFSTVGALECAIRVTDGVDRDLSEQWLVSCNRSGWSCGGGWFANDYHLRNGATDAWGGNGAVMETNFPYQAVNAACAGPYSHNYWIDSWAYIGGSGSVPTVDAIKQAIMNYGPVSVAVYVNSAFQSYIGGVFNGCGSGTINHAVVLVGWSDTDGAWIMRNSWGSGWGEGGYMRIAYNCSSIGYGACFVNYSSGWVSPSTSLSSSGYIGGLFTPSSTVYTLTNRQTTVLNWTATATQPWVTVSPTNGSLAANTAANVTVSINANAAGLAVGNYSDIVTFVNTANGANSPRSVTLTVKSNAVTAPSSLTASVSGAKKARTVTLSWRNNSSNQTYNEIWRAVDTGAFAFLAQAGATATRYSDTQVTTSHSYSYEIRACNTANCSGFSNIAKVTVR